MANTEKRTAGGVASCSLDLTRWKQLVAYMKKSKLTRAEVMRKAFDMLMESGK